MLSKEVCQKCFRLDGEENGFIWTIKDQDRWCAGVVECIHIAWPGITDIRKDPPEFCPYKFEHAVAEGMNNA